MTFLWAKILRMDRKVWKWKEMKNLCAISNGHFYANSIVDFKNIKLAKLIVDLGKYEIEFGANCLR